MDVVFPDGTVVRASSIRDRVEPDPTRSFGLYLDMRWLPTWPAEVIEWPDYGIPADRERAAVQIVSAFARARRGELVEVGCMGGLGRTGTVLACMGARRRAAGVGRGLGQACVQPGGGRDQCPAAVGAMVRRPCERRQLKQLEAAQ